MNRSITRGRLQVVWALLAMLVAPGALAGGPPLLVTFGPDSIVAAQVPTLGASALIVLALLLAIVALRAARNGRAGRVAALALFSAGLVAGGAGVERSMATSSFSVTAQGDCETGGSYVIFIRGGNEFTNDCPNPMRILGYEFQNGSCDLIPNNSESNPACVVGNPVAPGASCALPLCEIQEV